MTTISVATALAAITSGTLIATSLLISRRLNEKGVSANAVMTVRFAIGVSQTAPLTVQVIVSLSAILVFAAQLLDGRTHYAPATLICVLLYGCFILSVNVLRGWQIDPVK